MRLWSLHSKYLDRQGLLAVWREGLLAQKVLRGRTKGYRKHPQLQRFRQQKDPIAAIGEYLRGVHQESVVRGYRFDQRKIVSDKISPKIKVTAGQAKHELQHLLKKLRQRDQKKYLVAKSEKNIRLHPLFKVVKGSIEEWERIK